MNKAMGRELFKLVTALHPNTRQTEAYHDYCVYEDTITAEAIKEIARASLRKTDSSRELDLRIKYGSGKDVRAERELLKSVTGSADSDLDVAMQELVKFYYSLRAKYASNRANK